ncbi:MAG: HK97 family phage prohead protease [Bacteroidales bacterium]|nr:HK97 family phage prohead protease [Bacteroidales bacterium]
MAQTQQNRLTREFDGSLRAIEGEGNERKFELSFSSEEPYDRGFLEILDHSDGAVDLYRLNNLGVVLFNHDRDQVVGKVLEARIEDNRGVATIEFDTDANADVIYQKVNSGTLKGVSVCYVVDDWEIVAAGQKSDDGRFTGPCDIARKWTPLEISIVSVPADPTVGVGRDMSETKPVKRAPSNSVRQLQINLNKCL